MKFKAVFTERGLKILEKGFLPTLEKFGKNFQLLLGEEDVHFVQSVLNTDGTQVTVRFAVDVIFEKSNYKCQSKHYNLIGMSMDIALLLRVLRGADQNHADTLEVKLGLVHSTSPTSNEVQRTPFLIFAGRGQSLSMTQEMPISKPFSTSEIDRLVKTKDVAVLCPYYVDLQPAVAQLQALGERMKSLDDAVTLATTKAGDVHLQVSASTVLLGSQLQGLSVFPQTMYKALDIDRQLLAEDQLRAALESGDAISVCIQAKHLNRVLKATQLTQPSQLLCGIAEGGGYVHVMFVYRDPQGDAAYDDSMSVSFQLPVRQDV